MSDSEGKRSEPPSEGNEERRGEPRHLACFPAHIRMPSGSTRMSLIRDLSVSGARLLTRAKLEVGEPIRLSLYISEDANQARAATGHVVRVETRTPDVADVWHYTVGVHFDTLLHECEAEIEALARRQAARDLPKG